MLRASPSNSQCFTQYIVEDVEATETNFKKSKNFGLEILEKSILLSGSQTQRGYRKSRIL
jgi:hypothetical protein